MLALPFVALLLIWLGLGLSLGASERTPLVILPLLVLACYAWRTRAPRL